MDYDQIMYEMSDAEALGAAANAMFTNPGAPSLFVTMAMAGMIVWASVRRINYVLDQRVRVRSR